MWLSFRLLRASGVGTCTAAAVRRRLLGASRPPTARALRSPLLGGVGPNCLPFPRNGAPFGLLSCYLPQHGAQPPRDLRRLAFSTSANSAPVDAPKKDVDDQIADTHILRNLMKYLMLNDSPDFRFRLVLSLGLLVGAKWTLYNWTCINVYTMEKH